MTTTTTTAATTIHPFEARGLGKAPFRLVGLVKQDMAYGQVCLNRAEFDKTGILLTTKPGGTCAYCGTYIVNMFQVRSADGREFHVGCDCAEKVAKASADTDLTRALARAMKPVRDAQNAKARARKEARQAERGVANETAHAELLARLDRAGEEQHPAFRDMARALRSGKIAKLSDRQLAWLDRVCPA